MSVVETPTTISIMTDTVDAVNAKLNEYIDQIQTDCKSDLESYIREKMTIYYGKQLNQTFPVLTSRTSPGHPVYQCPQDCIYARWFGNARSDRCGNGSKLVFYITVPVIKLVSSSQQYPGNVDRHSIDISNPSIQILIDIILKVFPGNCNTYTNVVPSCFGHALYKSFVEMTKTFETHPLRYVQTDSKLISDLNAQRESVRNKKEQIAEDISQNIKDNKYLDEMTAQLKLEKQELQDYRNIKQEIEKCNILKRQLVIVKAGLAKEQAQLVLDKAQFEKEQTESLNIDLDDELFQFNT